MSNSNRYIATEYKSFIKLLDFSHGKYDIRDVFKDFVVMFAISIKNQIYFTQEEENLYLQTINKYNKEEMDIFPKLINELINLYTKENELKDILGEIYHQIGANSKGNQQFFTPNNVAKCMAAININKEDVKVKEYITINDPTCGSGVLLINAANYLDMQSINYKEKALFVGQDLDFVCVCMTYIQMSLYSMAGFVIQGDTLKNQCIRVFYTPQYLIGNWHMKNKKGDKR